ncbi:MAG: class II aldolase/adducin family protein [Pseudomonadota bacterium]
MSTTQTTEHPSSMSTEERQIRNDLAAAYRLVARFGWDDLVFTHISARVPGPDHHFLINPYGLLFEEITASSLVKVDMNGFKIDDSPYEVNPAGFTIHSAVHMAREDAGCVMHLHTVDGTAVSTHAEGLLPLNQTAQLILSDLSYHDYEGVAMDHDERPRLQNDLGASSTMLLRNHGTLTIGMTVAQAFTRMYFLERACSMQVATFAGNRELYPIAEDVMEKNAGIAKAGLVMTADALVWPALIRKLDREAPDYKD